MTTFDRGRKLGRTGLLRAYDLQRPLTARSRLDPTFLIVGAQRCGTTSMFKTLAQHPDVARPFLRKGIHYFDNNYERSWDWYRGHFPLKATARLRRRGRAVQTGESSPYYMFHPHAVTRIAHDLPDVCLLMLVRDPVERAYSAHAHEYARGYETLPFNEAIKMEPTRLDRVEAELIERPLLDSRVYQHNAYLARGRYIEQIERIAEIVGRDRLHVVDSGDFFTDPRPAFEQVEDFLGLPHAEGIAFERHNARSRSAMPDSIRAELADYFEPWDDALAKWWGRTPSWRR